MLFSTPVLIWYTINREKILQLDLKNLFNKSHLVAETDLKFIH